VFIGNSFDSELSSSLHIHDYNYCRRNIVSFFSSLYGDSIGESISENNTRNIKSDSSKNITIPIFSGDLHTEFSTKSVHE